MAAPNPTPNYISDAGPWLLGLIGRGEGGFLELRCRTRSGGVRQGFFPVDDPEGLYDRAVALGEHGDVWVSACVRGRKSGKASDAVRGNALWGDFDHGRERLDAFEWQPSLIVETSYTPRGCTEPRDTRYQAWWALAEPADLTDERERAEFVGALRGLQRATGSDPVGDVSRVMRAVGCLNWKHAEPNLVRPVFFEPGTVDV